MKAKRRDVEHVSSTDLFDDSFQVASMSECTGLIPSIPETEVELQEYSQIYDIPLPSHKNERRSKMNNNQNKNENRNNNQNKNENRNNNQNKNENKNNNQNRNDRSYND